jgi:hypothetical protein
VALRTLTLCASLLAILGLAGCAGSLPTPSIIPADIWWPVVSKPTAKKDAGQARRAKVLRIACPPLSEADKLALTGTVPRPADWADKGATKGELQAHVDALELDAQAKVAAAKRIMAEHERCRGGGGKAKARRAKTS